MNEEATRALDALLRATVQGQPVQALVDAVKACGGLNCRNAEGRSALMFAAACGRVDAVAALAAAGADVRLQDDDGMTALHFGVQSGSRDIVEKLLGLGAPVAATALSLDTALHFAAEGGRCGVCRIERSPPCLLHAELLPLAARLLCCMCYCCYVRSCVVIACHPLPCSSSVQSFFYVSRSPGLTLVVCSVELVKLLVQRGNANVEVLNDDGWSPAALAARNDYLDVVLWLCSHASADPLRAMEAATLATPTPHAGLIETLLIKGICPVNGVLPRCGLPLLVLAGRERNVALMRLAVR